MNPKLKRQPPAPKSAAQFAGETVREDLRNTKLTFKLDDGTVQEITLAQIQEQPFLALGKHHGLMRDLSRITAQGLIDRLKIRDTFTYLFKVGTDGTIPYTAASVQAAKDLGRSMLDLTLSGPLSDPAVNDSTIDSGYTYFGQFVDHDITRDDTSNLEFRQDANTIRNLRTPNFDLDSVYGRGPALDSHLYDGIKLKTGFFMDPDPANPGLNAINLGGMITDLPRVGPDALLGDNRNDENLIVQHLHLGFLCFHNAVVDALKAEFPAVPNGELFAWAQREVRRHYQWVVLHDFLRTICGSVTVDDVLQNGVKYFTSAKNKFTGAVRMPVEFSVAAYRFGHSMIRDQYNFNDNFNPTTGISNFSFAFLFTGNGGVANVGNPRHAAWRINWQRFFSSPAHQARNKARKIDTRVALHMGQLPGAANPGANFMAWISARNLVRSLALGVPTGQAVAQVMGIEPLTEAQLKSNPFENTRFVPVFDGPILQPASVAENVPSPVQPEVLVRVRPFPVLRPTRWQQVTVPATPEQQALHEATVAILEGNNAYLLHNTPLWFYILKEAEVLARGNHLGPIGGRIVTEVFVRTLRENPDSILSNPAWKPRFGVDADGNLRILDILKFAGRVPAQDAP